MKTFCLQEPFKICLPFPLAVYSTYCWLSFCLHGRNSPLGHQPRKSCWKGLTWWSTGQDCTSNNEGGTGLIPGWGTKVPDAMNVASKLRNTFKNLGNSIYSHCFNYYLFFFFQFLIPTQDLFWASDLQSPTARHPGMWNQVGLRKHHYEQS